MATVADKFMAMITYLADSLHHANVVNHPDVILNFPDQRELAYFEMSLKRDWDINKYGIYPVLADNDFRIRGLIIKLRVKARLPEDLEIIRK